MKTLFISDLHLSGERPEIISLFLDFLNQQACEAERLYILGDLFEVWLGDDYVDPAIAPVISALKAITDKGVPVYIMRGNRDFLLGDGFEKQTACRLIEDPLVIDLYGTATLLMHGDTLCTDDVDYQLLRKQFHDSAWQREFLSKPIEKRIAFARHVREESRRETGKKTDTIMDVNDDAVKQAFLEYNVLRMIHGHTHRPNTHTVEIDERTVTRTVLGDWYHQGSVLTCTPEGCSLESIRTP